MAATREDGASMVPLAWDSGLCEIGFGVLALHHFGLVFEMFALARFTL